MEQPWNDRVTSAALPSRYKSIWQPIVALVAAGLVATFAFALTFTKFPSWDDEGYFLQAYREFLSGRAPYDQVVSFYGPFSFLSAALVARFNAVNVTHDNFRWAFLLGWVVIALLLGGVVWRWTGRYSPALVAFLLVGVRLQGLAVSIGHPQLWIILAVAVLLWLGLDWIYLPGNRTYALWSGFLIGAILLCKINIAIFVSIAIALGASLQSRSRIRMIGSAVLMTAAAGLGLLLLFSSPTGAEKCFAFVYLGSLVLIVGVAIVRPGGQQLSATSLRWLIASLGMCVCAGVGAILACGTTLRGLFRGLITDPALLVRSYHHPFLDATRPVSVLLSVFGLAAAIGVFSWRCRDDVRRAWLGLLKIAVGIGLFCVFYYRPQEALTGSLLFPWLLLIDTQAMSQREYSNRLLLALLCPLFSLQLFPNAGTQVTWATLMPITAATVLLADGINCIDRDGFRMPLSSVISPVARGTAPLLAILLFLSVGKSAILGLRQWGDSQPVNLPGTHWLRLRPMEKDRLTVTVSELSQDCRTVLMIPGLYSYSLWSGVPPAEEKRINSWPFLWPDDVRKNELANLRRQNGGCVLVDRDVYHFFRQYATSPGSDELLSEVQRTMRPVYALQGLTLYESPQKPDPPLNSEALKRKSARRPDNK